MTLKCANIPLKPATLSIRFRSKHNLKNETMLLSNRHLCICLESPGDKMGKVLDVEGLPEDRVAYLESLIVIFRKQHQKSREQNGQGQVSVFATHDSDVIGGEFNRANAYE